MSFWRKSKLLEGYWGWFYSRRVNRLMLAANEGGREFAFNLQLWYGVIPCGFYFAVRLWREKWFRLSYGLKL